MMTPLKCKMMYRTILPFFLVLFTAPCTAQFEDLTADARLGCTASEAPKPAAGSAHNFGQIRLINRMHTVDAFVSGISQKPGTTFRIWRSVDPALGWEFIAEGLTPADGTPIAVPDENPLPGKVLYKLESVSNGAAQTLDIRVVNRPLGMELDEIDFLTSPEGALVLPAADLPEGAYTVKVYDLQGGEVEAAASPFGDRLKVSADRLPFGVYQIIIAGETSAVKKYFLASGNY